MAYATTPTLLALDRYAQIMGIQPLGFNGGVSSVIFPTGPSCADVWFQYTWQHADQVSREDLARSIASAERDIANVLGYQTAPAWVESEAVRYPQYLRPDLYGLGMRNVRGQYKSVKLQWGRFIQGGKRATPLQATVAPAFSSPSVTTFNDTVTVTAAGIDDDAILCEVKVYVPGYSGDPAYEIRPARSATLTAGTYVGIFWAWQFLLPSLLDEIPNVNFATGGINADDPDSYLDSVEVRWTYNKYADSHGSIYWESEPAASACCAICAGVGCPTCQFTAQAACIFARNTNTGMVAIAPGSYDADDERWETATQAVCRDPDQASVNYYAGEQSDRYLAGWTCDPLEHYLAEAIAYLATARLERPYCSCGVITALGNDLRRDLSIVSTDKTSYFTGDEVHDNPFGTRLGEVKAWRRIKHLVANSVNVGGSV